MRPARRSAPGQRAKLARNPPRQSSVASVTSIETKPAEARRAQYWAMLASRWARGTWPNSDRIVIGNNISDMAAGRDVERPIAAVRHLSLPRRPAHRDHGLGHGGEALGDVPKAVDLAGCDVERPPTAMLDHAADDFGHVIDQHVIAPLLAFAEQHDLLPCRRQPTESVGALAVVPVPRPV